LAIIINNESRGAEVREMREMREVREMREMN
jgi:hypothetical protein